MTEKQTKTKKNGDGDTVSTGFDALVDLNTEAFNVADEVTQNLLEGFEAYRQEVLRFVGRRLRRDFAVPHSLLSCLTPQEAFNVYLDFMQTAQKDYVEQIGRFARIGQHVAEATLEEIELETTGVEEPAGKRARA